jgi:hypothetical protein
MKQKLLTFAGALALLAVVGKFYAVPVMAQVRAALVKNLDEPARNPYMQTAFVSCSSPTTLCDILFPAPPAGRRLVVQHLSANIGAPNGINVSLLLAPGNVQFALPAHVDQAPANLSVNEPVLAYFEPGQIPLYRIAIPVGSSVAASAVISGYLVDLTQ